jgi:hypothetical protein
MAVIFEDHRVALLLDELPEPVERIAELAAQSVHWDQVVVSTVLG